MSGLPAWRSLNSVMILTVYVALVSYAIRMTLGPTSMVGAFVVALPASLTVSVFLIWPVVRYFARAFEAGDGPGDGPCRACGYPTRRPLFRGRGSLFPELAGFRCPGCGTTYRQVGEFVVEERPVDLSSPVPESGIWFEGEERSLIVEEP